MALQVKHFRPYMIHKSSKTLRLLLWPMSPVVTHSELLGRILDFNRIKDKERKALFGCESSLYSPIELEAPSATAQAATLLFAGERGKKLLEVRCIAFSC